MVNLQSITLNYFVLTWASLFIGIIPRLHTGGRCIHSERFYFIFVHAIFIYFLDIFFSILKLSVYLKEHKKSFLLSQVLRLATFIFVYYLY